ncbi:MAG: glycosyltransferase family 1 protein [Deltaproteobacteria bacterium]|nr:MAG: glycosyltransferase family 1 protein [Deltaproteobacteria bacterium]
MNILMITENDPAGMGIAFTNAINRYTEHSCRLVTTTTKYNFNFDKDLHVPDLDEDGLEQVRDLLRHADIIHFHVLADENIELGPIRVKDFIKGKAILHHHHGHPDFRANPEKYRKKYRSLRRKVLVSTPDLLRMLPEATWQPNLVPINDPLLLPSPATGNGCVVIGQSVTRKDLKDTADLLNVVAGIGRNISFPKVKVDIIENTEHRECLERKRKCHIAFDHMQGYYGVSSLESLSQGKAVIAGLDEWNRGYIKEFTGSDELPWVIAQTQDELQDKLERLITDGNLRGNIGVASRSFMEECWAEQQVLKILLEIYRNL